MKLSPEAQRHLLDEACKRSFEMFFRRSFYELIGTPLAMAPYIGAIANVLERVFRGELDRVIITMPPRCGKSLMCSTTFPAWVMGHDPSAKFMVASYGQELVQELGEGTRDLMRSPFFKRLFPNARLVRGDGSKTLIKTTEGGARRGVSRGGAATGFGTKFMVIDDIHKADEALTAAGQLSAMLSFQNTLSSRFDNPTEGRIIVVQQRLSDGDLVGQLLEMGGWYHLNLPAIAEMDETFELSGGGVWHRKKGDLLHPTRLPKDYLDDRLRIMGPRSYYPQYQQYPFVAEGALVQWEWFGQYDEQPERRFFHRIVQSWDPAWTDGPTSDFSAGQTWGFREGKWYLLDVIRVRLRFHKLKERVIAWHKQWKADALIIEGCSVGDDLWDEVKAEGVPGLVIAPKPRGSKEERLAGKTAQLATGVYLLPSAAPWLGEFRRELLAFPDPGVKDDQVDALTQFLEFAFDRRGWVNTRYTADGRRIRKERIERRNSTYYEGNAPSQSSW